MEPSTPPQLFLGKFESSRIRSRASDQDRVLGSALCPNRRSFLKMCPNDRVYLMGIGSVVRPITLPQLLLGKFESSRIRSRASDQDRVLASALRPNRRSFLKGCPKYRAYFKGVGSVVRPITLSLHDALPISFTLPQGV